MKLAWIVLKVIFIALGAFGLERLWALAHPGNQAYLGIWMLGALMLLAVCVLTTQMLRAYRA